MTACTNNGGSRARRAVTAALVGVLSVGAAPMVALATNAAPASGDVSLMATDQQVIQEGTVTYKGEDSYVANGDPQGLEAVTLTPANPGAEPIDLEYTTAGAQKKAGYYYFYVDLNSSAGNQFTSATGKVEYLNSSNKPVQVEGEIVAKPSTVGTYAVVTGYLAEDLRTWTFVDDAETFTIKARSLDGATLVEDGNVDDTTFTWNGTKDGRTVATMPIDVALDGVILTKGKDYSAVNFYIKNTDTGVTEVEPGKTYVARVIGMGNYVDQTAEVEFEIQPLDLDSATITGGVFSSALTNPASFTGLVNSVNGVYTGTSNSQIGNGYVAIEFVKTPSGSSIFDGSEVGEYTYKVVPVDLNGSNEGTGNAWVTGEKEIKVTRANIVVTFSAGSNSAALKNGAYRFDMTDEDTEYFDLDEITAITAGVDKKDIDFTITAADGSEATEADLTKGGTWYVTASVYYMNSSNQLVAGKQTFKVVNSYDDINYSNIYVSLDGKNVESGTTEPVTYTGEDFADKIAVKVAKNDMTLTEGTDYTVTIKDEDGKTVDSVVDAGEYTVVVKGLTFTGSFSFTIEVKPAVVEWLFPNYNVVTNDTLESGKYDGFFAYTGDVIDATYTCVDDKGKVIEVPASAFTITYTLDGEKAELKEAGEYLGTIKDATVNDNWQVGNKFGVQKIVVSKDKVFADVKSSDFFAQAIYTASAQGYIGGIGGTNLFAPMNQLTRADMACVLYRMAGGSIKASQEDLTDENVATISQFSDVDPHAYYAKAVAWCVEMGIANGYGDTFGSARSISTEEFVTMLARYAAKMGDDTSVDTDAVLAGVADGDQVSGYARDAVAWAVENGYIAKGGNLIAPQESVARWRTVMIAVDYQPEQLHVIGNPDATKPGTGTNN